MYEQPDYLWVRVIRDNETFDESWFDIPDPRRDPLTPGRILPVYLDDEEEF